MSIRELLLYCPAGHCEGKAKGYVQLILCTLLFSFDLSQTDELLNPRQKLMAPDNYLLGFN